MRHFGILLAGGRSSRMGQDKAELVWSSSASNSADQTLLHHMQDCLQNSLCEQVFISRNHACFNQNKVNQSKVEQSKLEPSDSIPDRIPNKGPLSGIDATLQHISAHISKLSLENNSITPPSIITIVPVDMPLLDSESLLKLQTYSEKTQRSVCYQQAVLPCVVWLTPKLLSYLEQQLSDDEDANLAPKQTKNKKYSIQGMLNFLEADRLVHADPQRLSNTNTPEEWRQILAENI